MKHLFILLFLNYSIATIAQPLKVHTDQHYLTDAKGAPFFWLADTGWELFHRLDRAETERYIEKRKVQGFNIIQAVVLFELQAFESPNAYGDFPLVGKDIQQLALTEGNEVSDQTAYDYWDHVKFVVETAAKHDMIVGLLPAWGEYVTPRKRKRIIKTIEEGYDYGFFIGDWLKDYNDHIVWILGGDRLPDEQPKGVDIWRAMAEGVTDGVNEEESFDGKANYDQTFMTYHCYASSSNWFAEDAWIDMHTWGSYHGKRDNERAYLASWAEWTKKNHKPYVNSEPAYENLPINYDWAKVSNGRFDDFDVRQIAYWSIFSGCTGHTYGAHEVWIMHKMENKSPPLTISLTREWETALEYKGAEQMKYLKQLMLSYDFFSRQPNKDIIAQNPNDPMGKLIACSGKDYALVYTPTGESIIIDQSKLTFKRFKSYWFNPRNGERFKAKSQKKGDYRTFDPPNEIARGNDWVLILEALSKSTK